MQAKKKKEKEKAAIIYFVAIRKLMDCVLIYEKKESGFCSWENICYH